MGFRVLAAYALYEKLRDSETEEKETLLHSTFKHMSDEGVGLGGTFSFGVNKKELREQFVKELLALKGASLLLSSVVVGVRACVCELMLVVCRSVGILLLQ